jgi:hypothetical protein
MLTNKKAVKKMALDFAKKTRCHEFSRVGKSFVDAIESETRVAVAKRVNSAPSLGKKLK